MRVDGRPLGEPNRSLRIVEPLTIAIEGVGRIPIRPAVPDRRRLQASVREAERQIGRELEVLGLRPPNRKARQLELGLTAAARPPLAVAPAADGGRFAVLARGRRGRDRARRAPSARSRAWSRSSARRAARLDAAVEERHRQAAARAQAVARLAQAERRLEQLRAELAAAERDRGRRPIWPPGSRELQGRVGVAEQRLRQLQEQAPPQPLEELEQQMAGLRARVERACRLLLRERELALERLRERIQVVSGGGLDERLAAARRRLDELERGCAKYRREVEALELLLRVLQDAERDAKERYVGPVVRRLRPYLQALFPGAELEIDSGFRITAVARARRAASPSSA